MRTTVPSCRTTLISSFFENCRRVLCDFVWHRYNLLRTSNQVGFGLSARPFSRRTGSGSASDRRRPFIFYHDRPRPSVRPSVRLSLYGESRSHSPLRKLSTERRPPGKAEDRWSQARATESAAGIKDQRPILCILNHFDDPDTAGIGIFCCGGDALLVARTAPRARLRLSIWRVART